MNVAGQVLHSLSAEPQLGPYSEQAGEIKLMNTETCSLYYTDLNAMTRL